MIQLFKLNFVPAFGAARHRIFPEFWLPPHQPAFGALIRA